MTLQQLRYVTAIVRAGTLSGAAKELFVAQPSLTKAVKELEKEMGIVIFTRTNKGVELSKDGEIFLGYARQVLDQADLLEERYLGRETALPEYCVSTQHYSFSVKAFVDLINEAGGNRYDFSLRETETYEIIEDVARLRSEVGVLFLNDFNESVLQKLFREKDLEFTELAVAKPHVFVSTAHPLAGRASIKMEELLPYPYLSFEQGAHNSFYFSEEIFSTMVRPKNIRVRDRATLFNLLIGLNGYTACSGIIHEDLNGSTIVAVPLEQEGDMRLGYICHKRRELSRLGEIYVEALKRHTSEDAVEV